MPHIIHFSIENGDITEFVSDVVVLKYARSFHGADQAVALKLSLGGIDVSELEAPTGKYRIVETRSQIQAPYALYIGVDRLGAFRYEQIRQFSRDALSILAEQLPDTTHIAMTLHGANYGLDESEAMLQEFKGILDGLQSEKFPAPLERITVVEHTRGRVQRLKQALEQYLANDELDYVAVDTKNSTIDITVADIAPQPINRRRTMPSNSPSQPSTSSSTASPAPSPRVEPSPETKPHAFIAMPFKKEMDDVFFYGIQQPVHGMGLLCERVDQDAFTGGIMEYVKQRIETAAVVIAELSGANPNVYLEVGYAWGKSKPTILLVRDEKELHFDVRGQRCLTYERIKDLEEALSKEIKLMMLKGIIKP